MTPLSLAAAFSGAALLAGLWRVVRRSTDEPAANDSSPEQAPPALPAWWTGWGAARPELRGWPKDSVLAVRGLAKHPSEVLRALLEIAEHLGVPVDTLAVVIAHESGWAPSALYFRDKNDDGTPRKVPFVAAGLCQLTVQAHLEGFGNWERVREVATWSAERQLREVVLPLWTNYGQRVHGADPGLGVMLNFLPDKAGKPLETVLGERGAEGLLGSVYAMNKGLDTNDDGKITVGDVYASAARICRAAKGTRIRVDGSLWIAPAFRTAAKPAVLSVAAPASPGAPTAAPARKEESRIATPKPEKPASAKTVPPSTAARSLRLTDPSGGLLLAAIRDGREEAPTWMEVPWEGRGKTAGVRLMLRVSAHCVRAPMEIEGLGKRLLRLPISYREQIEVCRLRKWFPLTQSISDAIWVAARRLSPVALGKWKTLEEQEESSRRMKTLEWTVKFNEGLDRQIPDDSRPALWATEGKDWIVHPKVERADGRGAVNYGLHGPDGVPLQSPGAAHDWDWSDYSQTLRAMEWEATDRESGKKVSILEVLRKAGMPAAVLEPFEAMK